MAAATKLDIRKTIIQITIGLVLAVTVVSFKYAAKEYRSLSFYELIELRLLDQRYLINGGALMDPRVGTIDIDAASLKDRGRYQDWTRDNYAEMIDVLVELEVDMVAFDIFFPERSASGILKLNEFLQTKPKSLNEVKTLFRDYDEELRLSIINAGNVILGQYFTEADEQDPELVENEIIRPEKGTLKDSSLMALEPYNKPYPEWKESGLRMYTDIEPPIPEFVNASKGVGLAMTVADIDGAVRHYPIVLVYDGKIWPSLALNMYLEYIHASLKDIEIVPGEKLIIPPGVMPDGTEVGPLNIPIDSDGLMMVNWAGDWGDENFLHIPFYSLFKLKDSWKETETAAVIKKVFAENIGPDDNIWADQFIEKIMTVLMEKNVDFEDEATVILFFNLLQAKYIEDDFILIDRIPTEEYVMDGMLDENFMNLYRTLLHNNKMTAVFAEQPDISLEAMADLIDVQQPDSLKRGYVLLKNMLKNESLKPENRPLSFSENVYNGRILTKEDFKGKVFAFGLTAAGTWDLNPMPFSRRYAMLGLHANVFNSLILQDFLWRLSFWQNILLILLIGLLMGIIVPRFKPLLGVTVIFLILTGYMALSQLLFNRIGLWIDVFGPVLVIIFGYTSITVYNFFSEEKEKKMIREIFSRFVTKSVVDELIKNPDMVKLGGEKKVLTVFFSDVAGFTSVSEKLTPEELVSLLNEYLTAMTSIVLKYEGMIDKYEGDAIMAVFGTPIMFEDHPLRACYVSLEMQEELAKLREKWKTEGKPELKARIGMNTGPMVAGNMGSIDRLDYTVMGDAVNLGSRLEGANKQYGTYIMISESTYILVKDDIEVRYLDALRVKGKNEPIKVYEVLGRKDQGISEDMIKARDFYDQGMEKYLNQEWDESVKQFENALSELPDDPPSKVYIERCKEFKENPPPHDWDGVFTMTTK